MNTANNTNTSNPLVVPYTNLPICTATKFKIEDFVIRAMGCQSVPSILAEHSQVHQHHRVNRDGSQLSMSGSASAEINMFAYVAG
jgi:hypothetical protein